MLSTMMSEPLTITKLMNHVNTVHGDIEVASIPAHGPTLLYSYSDAFKRARKLANAIDEFNIAPGARIGSLAWNDHRHFELYYATSCSGRICHTINPRLSMDQIAYIIEHAGDELLFVDQNCLKQLNDIFAKAKALKAIIVMADESEDCHLDSPNMYDYEEIIRNQPTEYDWPYLTEDSASSMCYTSGTTGNPKGVIYSHRSTILHTYASSLPSAFNISPNDVVLPVVPMFHVNGWGLVYSAPMSGAKLVLPGQHAGDPAKLYKIIFENEVTVAAGVPTIWLSLLKYLDSNNLTLPALQRIIVGGAACPEIIIRKFKEDFAIDIQHAWGMTEMSPLGTLNQIMPKESRLSTDKQLSNRLKQGRPIFGVEIRIEDDSGNEVMRDGVSAGHLKVRGPWVTKSYYGSDDTITDNDGWFDTGDIATISSDGLLKITDRAKDLIKSGGEWISSIEVENCVLNHPGVAEAAVISVAHQKWSERPLLFIVQHSDYTFENTEILEWLRGKIPNWWIPDDCIIVDSLPYTSTGKLDKKSLRKRMSNRDDYLSD